MGAVEKLCCVIRSQKNVSCKTKGSVSNCYHKHNMQTCLFVLFLCTGASAAWVLSSSRTAEQTARQPSQNPAHASLLHQTDMEQKKALEAFRVRQFAGPHPALAADATGEQLGAPVDPLGMQLVPDHERVIIHFDVDCFYAQGAPGQPQPGRTTHAPGAKTHPSHPRSAACFC
jgi:hypothetical protein